MSDFEKKSKNEIFEGSKSLYATSYRSKAELSLLKRLEDASKVKQYFQPQVYMKINVAGCEYSIKLDFYVEYANGGVDLIHIASAEMQRSPELQTQIFSRARNLLKLRNFGFVVFTANKAERPGDVNTSPRIPMAIENFCFVNFQWIN